MPQVPTERVGVYANAFPGERRTVWTLYNARFTTVHGPVIAVPRVKGATYRDAWNDRVLTPKIAGGKAILSLTLHPQEVGCLLQERE